MAVTGKICLVLDDTGASSPARHALELVRYLRRRDLRLHAVSLAPAGALAIDLQHESVAVHTLDLPEPGGARGAWWTFAGTLTLFNLFRELRPDIVHVLGRRAQLAARVAARFAGAPWIVETVQSGDGSGGLCGVIGRMTSSLVDLAIVPSDVLAREAVHRLGVHPARLRRIRHGIDLARHTAVAPAGFPPGRPLIGTIARLVPEKGIDVLVSAAALLRPYHPELRVVIAGVGPDALRYVRWSQRLGISDRITFVGERADVPAVLAALDVFVLPSRREGAPLALLEALAAARPVVASDLPAVAEVVEHEVDGLLVPPEHPALLADAIDRLLVDRVLAGQLGAAGRTRVRQHHLAAPMAGATEDLYSRLLADLGRDRAAAVRHGPPSASSAMARP